jgi:hypothetical protein
MVIPAVYWKPTILFNIFYSGLQEALNDIGHVKILDFYNFSSDDLKCPQYYMETDKIFNRFIYKKEKESIKSLKKILSA